MHIPSILHTLTLNPQSNSEVCNYPNPNLTVEGMEGWFKQSSLDPMAKCFCHSSTFNYYSTPLPTGDRQLGWVLSSAKNRIHQVPATTKLTARKEIVFIHMKM